MRITYLPFLFIMASCTTGDDSQSSAEALLKKSISSNSLPVTIKRISDIPLPKGYIRLKPEAGSFAAWLKMLPLKKDKTVFLYNGQPKRNQQAQYAVVDMSTGKEDLQQCADVVMRLRAEYLFSAGKYNEIRFTDFEGKAYAWKGGNNRAGFDQYLRTVFGMCGSASLEKQLNTVTDFTAIKPGDVLIRGGFPGHAVIVADMAMNKKGDKIYLLIQGYQPAQDTHVLVNPLNSNLSLVCCRAIP
ncbi:MAG: hypothetical protein IPP93_17040 [Chitinophagaceae bacterium]|nr:hypothetical protein [Chitinophagaceae bacterium]